MTVTTVFASSGTADDGVDSNNNVFITADAGSNLQLVSTLLGDTGTSMVMYAFPAPLAATNYEMAEGFESFDTSAIADTDVITAVVLSLKGESANVGVSGSSWTVEAREYDFGAPVTTADWRSGTQLGALTRYATMAIGSWSTSAFNAFTADGTNFNTATNMKTGNVRMVICSSRHVADVAPLAIDYASWLTADTTGTTSDPKLDITSTSGAASVSDAFQPNRRSTQQLLTHWRK